MQTGYTYLIKQGEYLKIGYTTNISNRMKQYDTHNASYALLYTINGNCEKKLHDMFSVYRVKNEWFEYNESILKYFDEHGNNESSVAVNVHTLSNLIDNMSGVAIKLLIKSIALSQSNNNGLMVFKITPEFKRKIASLKVLSNLNMYLNELIENNCIYRIARGVYGINSLIAYCGALHNDANLSVKIFTRLDAEAKNNQP